MFQKMRQNAKVKVASQQEDAPVPHVQCETQSLSNHMPSDIWPLLFACLLQLLGFVYACYVVSAITEEEDSCEWLHTHTHLHPPTHTHTTGPEEICASPFCPLPVSPQPPPRLFLITLQNLQKKHVFPLYFSHLYSLPSSLLFNSLCGPHYCLKPPLMHKFSLFLPTSLRVPPVRSSSCPDWLDCVFVACRIALPPPLIVNQKAQIDGVLGRTRNKPQKSGRNQRPRWSDLQ